MNESTDMSDKPSGRAANLETADNMTDEIKVADPAEVSHSIPVDGLPRDFVFHYHALPTGLDEKEAAAWVTRVLDKANKTTTANVGMTLVVEYDEQHKHTVFHAQPHSINTLWLGDRLKAAKPGEYIACGGSFDCESRAMYVRTGKHDRLM